MSRSSRIDPYSAQMREEQKAILHGLLGIIYDSYDTTRRIQSTVDSIYRMTVVILIFILFIVGVGLLSACYYGCRREGLRTRTMYQGGDGNASPHQPRKNVPIEL